MGLPHAIAVTTADVIDRDGAIQMIHLNLDNLSCVKKFLVDGGYSGERFANQVKDICGAQVEVVKLTDTRTAVDFAHFLRELVEVYYSHCEKIVLVMDNLNIHSIASLYKAFDPAIARQIAQRLEIHHTPIHASWLNMAEIEIGILSRQCLYQSMSSFQLMARQVNAWTLHRNAVSSTVHWKFSISDARYKLRKLYPTIF